MSNLGIENISTDHVVSQAVSSKCEGKVDSETPYVMKQIESNIKVCTNNEETYVLQMDVDSKGGEIKSVPQGKASEVLLFSNCNSDVDTSDDDFQDVKVKQKTFKKHTTDSEVPTDSDSDNELISTFENRCSTVELVLPKGHEYKFESIHMEGKVAHFNSSFKIDIKCEEAARKWVQEYNETTKETMVYERNRKGTGKNVIRKLYMRCQHKQRETGKHIKSSKPLKTTFKEHNNKQTHCPAQLTITVLASNKKNGNKFLVIVDLKHIHNHPVHIADALRFRRVSDETCEKYYGLFKLGHSPASAHLEYETNLMLEHDNPHVLADRSLNPKISDVYNLFNKWRKTNLGKRTGLDLFEQLEKCVAIYNEENKTKGGKALLKRYTSVKCKSKEDHKDQPLILAICTPLMARVHEHVMQSSELIFVDASSSFDDFNNPMFVLSTLSAAGGLPLGIVLTSGETANIIHEAMSTLSELLPEQSFFGKGSPSNIITDDSIAERDGLHRTRPTATFIYVSFIFCKLCGDGYGIVITKYKRMIDST